MGRAWPGVADPDAMYLWGALCPNPAVLLNLPDAKTAHAVCDRRRYGPIGCACSAAT